MPFDGARPVLTAMLMNACPPNCAASPAAASSVNTSSSSSSWTNTRTTIARKSDRDHRAGDQPEFLADHREDIVGMRLGQLELDRAAARPGAGPAARGERRVRACRSGNDRPAPLALDVGEQEGVDAAARVVVEEIGRDQPRRRPRRPARRSPAATMPAIISSTNQTAPKMIVWPKSGCIISSTATSRGHRRR